MDPYFHSPLDHFLSSFASSLVKQFLKSKPFLSHWVFSITFSVFLSIRLSVCLFLLSSPTFSASSISLISKVLAHADVSIFAQQSSA